MNNYIYRQPTPMDEEEPGDSTKIGPLVGKRKTELQVVMFVNK